MNIAKHNLAYRIGMEHFGHKASEELYNRLATQKGTKSYILNFKKETYEKDYGLKVHDCAGLIEGYLICDDAESFYNPEKYTAEIDNGITYLNCKEKGLIKSIPEIKGLLVFKPGHVGVYIGKGRVIEAKGHAYGVVETELSKGDWRTWGKCPFIEYIESEEEPMINELIKSYGENAVKKALIKLIESVNDDGKEAKWATEEFEEAKKLEITDGTNP